MKVEREQWVSALTAVPEAALKAVVDGFPASWSIRPKVLPQAGLGMLKLRDSAFNEPFYLGEFPLASCWITLTTDDGTTVEGAAQVMDDRVECVEQLALCDAVLAARLPGWESVSSLVEQGMAVRERTAQQRKTILARTRVDFSLLDDVGDDDA